MTGVPKYFFPHYRPPPQKSCVPIYAPMGVVAGECGIMMIHFEKKRNAIENGVNSLKFEVTIGHLVLEIGLSDIVNNLLLQATVLAIEPKYFT